jgi:RNA polymerase sigma-70 factor (ECF subfamily)
MAILREIARDACQSIVCGDASRADKTTPAKAMPQTDQHGSEDSVPTRASLLLRLQRVEDNDTWKEFFDLYWKLIYQVALKAGLTESEAEDVVQETIIAVARNIPDFKYDPAKGSFKNWLLRMTRWRIVDQYRKRLPTHLFQKPGNSANHDRTSTVDGIEDPSPPELEAIWSEEWSKNLMHATAERVKQQVSARQYQIFELCVGQQWTCRRVARALRINIGRVYMARHRVSTLFKKELKKIEKKDFKK